jgi:hypothetical protein
MYSTPNNSLGSSVAYRLCRKDLSTEADWNQKASAAFHTKNALKFLKSLFCDILYGRLQKPHGNCRIATMASPPLFVYLNSIYLVAVFYRLGYPLREKLRDLGKMKMNRCCIQRYSNALSMDITPSGSFARHELSALLGNPLVW